MSAPFRPWRSVRRREEVPRAMGRWGLCEFVEPKLRPLVAEHLGVSVGQLVSQVSLREDLGADSLDLVELALLLETRFGIALSDRLLDDVRSYGDLVDVTVSLLLKRAADEKRPAESPPRVWDRDLRSTPIARRHGLPAPREAVWLPTDREARWPPAA